MFLVKLLLLSCSAAIGSKNSISPTFFNDLLNMDTQQPLDNFLTAEPYVTAVDVC